jgi:hypothetical protein
MFPTDYLPKPTGERAETDAYRYRLQRAYMVMIRAYLRRHSQSLPAASSTPVTEVNHV